MPTLCQLIVHGNRRTTSEHFIQCRGLTCSQKAAVMLSSENGEPDRRNIMLL